jgi:hypothetical protein
MSETPKGVNRRTRKTRGDKTIVMKELGLIRHYEGQGDFKRYNDSQKFDAETQDGPYEAPVAGYLAKVNIPDEVCAEYSYPFKFGEVILVFGDIAKMPGHCVIAAKDGRVHFGYHTENFTPLTDEEI